MARKYAVLVVSAVYAIALSGCVKAQPPTDTGTSSSSSPTAPTSPTNPNNPTTPATTLAYDPDLKPIFNQACVVCHSGSRPSANYDMTTYAKIMKDVSPGSASSRLVTKTQSNGSMYRYFFGDRAAAADMVKRWVVTYNAAQTR